MSEPKEVIRRKPVRVALTVIAALAVVAVVVAVVLSRRPSLPSYVAVANGRIEATEYDVSTKIAGRLADLAPHEGDVVRKDEIVGHIAAQQERADYSAATAKAKAAVDAQQEAEQSLRSAESDLELARSNLSRIEYLFKEHASTKDQLDKNQSEFKSAKANVAAARAKVAETRSKGLAARSEAESVETRVVDADLKSPVEGPVLYRIVEPGTMLAPGDKVLTVIDPTDMYMTVFVPTDQVGKVQVGDEAVIVLDAVPKERIPARVRFVSPRNQFTPREVETRKEREKLMFRVKVYVDPSWLAKHGPLKPGMPGVTYLRLDPSKPWPTNVAGSADE